MAEELISIGPRGHRTCPAYCSIYNREVLVSTATYDTRAPHPCRARAMVRTTRGRGTRFRGRCRPDGGGVGLAQPLVRPACLRPSVEVSVYVDEESRGRGIGKRLLRALVEPAGALGHHALLARISADNTVSVRLHESAGLAVAGTLREVGTSSTGCST